MMKYLDLLVDLGINLAGVFVLAVVLYSAGIGVVTCCWPMCR